MSKNVLFSMISSNLESSKFHMPSRFLKIFARAFRMRIFWVLLIVSTWFLIPHDSEFLLFEISQRWSIWGPIWGPVTFWILKLWQNSPKNSKFRYKFIISSQLQLGPQITIFEKYIISSYTGTKNQNRISHGCDWNLNQIFMSKNLLRFGDFKNFIESEITYTFRWFEHFC